MPKNSKGGIVRIPRLPSSQPDFGVPRQSQDGSGGGVSGPEAMIFSLDRLRLDVLRELATGDPVLIQLESLPIYAETLTGQIIGEIRLDDVEEVRSRRIRRATVLVAETDPPRCILEGR